MTVSQQQLITDLDALTEDQIEVGLEAGVWGDPARPVVQRYLDQVKLRRVEAVAAEQLEAARTAIEAAQAAAEEDRRAYYRGRGNAGSNGISVRCISGSATLDLVRGCPVRCYDQTGRC